MKVKGKTFSEKFDMLCKIHKGLGSDNQIELLNQWAKSVVTVLDEIDESFAYTITIDLEPNPASIKGIDAVSVKVWKSSRNPPKNLSGLPMYEKPYVIHTSDRQHKLENCIMAINAQLDEKIDRSSPPEIVELGGKRYQLVEIK
jgi:hypothetical protein